MGLSWQQGPLVPGAIGRFLVPDPLPERLLCTRLQPEPGQTVTPHGIDRNLTTDEVGPSRQP